MLRKLLIVIRTLDFGQNSISIENNLTIYCGDTDNQHTPSSVSPSATPKREKDILLIFTMLKHGVNLI